MSNFSNSEIELIQGLFSGIHPMPKNDFLALLSFVKKTSFKKGEIILNIGEIDSKINFVIRGLVHTYEIIDGKEFTVNLALPGMVFNSLNSYIKGHPTHEEQVAIHDTDILYLEKEKVELLLKKYHSFSIAFGKLYEQILLEREQRAILLQHKSAHMRYKYFISTFNRSQTILNEVPNKLISQYLCLAPETFCRNKNHMLKEHCKHA